jgi:pimeloyl-ACP methyl ester carboxylesterase
MTYGFIEVNGGDLCYDVRGHGHPLLLLHAGIADSRMWDDQIEPFAQHYQVVRYDMRGWGRSAVVPGPLAHHEDAAALLRVLGLEKAHVLGVSFGGYVAVDFTLAHPEMVTALVLGAPIVSGYEPSSEGMQRFFAQEEEALNRGDLEVATEVNLRMWVDGPWRAPDRVDPSVRERVRQMQLQAFQLPTPEGVEVQELAPPAITRLAEIQVPTLIIVGEQDVPEFVAISDIVTAGIRGAQKEVIPGVAHVPSMEKPGFFNEIVLSFLSDLPPAAGAVRD